MNSVHPAYLQDNSSRGHVSEPHHIVRLPPVPPYSQHHCRAPGACSPCEVHAHHVRTNRTLPDPTSHDFASHRYRPYHNILQRAFCNVLEGSMARGLCNAHPATAPRVCIVDARSTCEVHAHHVGTKPHSTLTPNPTTHRILPLSMHTHTHYTPPPTYLQPSSGSSP